MGKVLAALVLGPELRSQNLIKARYAGRHLEENRQMVPGGFLANQSSQNAKLKVQWKTMM